MVYPGDISLPQYTIDHIIVGSDTACSKIAVKVVF